MSITKEQTKTPTGCWGVSEQTLELYTKKELQTISITQEQSTPVILETSLNDEHQDIHIDVAANTHITIIHTITGTKGMCAVTINQEKDSTVTYLNIQKAETLYVTKHAILQENAEIDFIDLTTNNTTTKTKTLLAGAHARTNTIALFFGNGEQNEQQPLQHIVQIADHKAPKTTAQLTSRGIAKNNIALCEGEIIINAKDVDSHQEAHALLLNQEAHAKMSPRLFINNYEVTCSHATSVSKPDKELLFYLQSRGLSTQDAQQHLLKAFIWKTVMKLNKKTQELIIPYLHKELERYNQ